MLARAARAARCRSIVVFNKADLGRADAGAAASGLRATKIAVRRDGRAATGAACSNCARR